MTLQVGPGELGPFHCPVNRMQITGAAEHVSSCKLMFTSKTEDLNRKIFMKSMNFPNEKSCFSLTLCQKM